jgi:hypothetical protein
MFISCTYRNLYQSTLRPVWLDRNLGLRSLARKRRHLPSSIFRTFSRQRGRALVVHPAHPAGLFPLSGGLLFCSCSPQSTMFVQQSLWGVKFDAVHNLVLNFLRGRCPAELTAVRMRRLSVPFRFCHKKLSAPPYTPFTFVRCDLIGQRFSHSFI